MPGPGTGAGHVTGDAQHVDAQHLDIDDIDDIDRAQTLLGRAFYPLRVEPTGEGRFSLRMRTVQVGPLVLGELTYGTDIRKECGELDTAYHVNVPLHGEVWSTCGDEQVVATPRTAAVFDPVGATVLDRWTAGTTQLCLKIDRDTLVRELEQRLDRPVGTLPSFRMSMGLATAGGRSWLHAVRILASELDSPGGLAQHPLLAAEVSRLITGGLLLGQPHSLSDELDSPVPGTRPRTVKLVMDRLEARPEHPWTLGELARETGISVRTIEDGFRRHVGVTPTAFLRRCRLDRVRADLLAAPPACTGVAEVAHRWGFTHLGRFAQAYRRRFDEYPSDTLRR